MSHIYEFTRGDHRRQNQYQSSVQTAVTHVHRCHHPNGSPDTHPEGDAFPMRVCVARRFSHPLIVRDVDTSRRSLTAATQRAHRHRQRCCRAQWPLAPPRRIRMQQLCNNVTCATMLHVQSGGWREGWVGLAASYEKGSLLSFIFHCPLNGRFH